MITVSICVPVYGVERYIERCARSVFEQTYDNIEYIFVDDCSPDHSIDILKNVIKEYPARKHNVRIVRHEHNRGLAAARNTAIDNAEGEFVLHVDSDDYIPSDYVSLLASKQSDGNHDIVVNKVVKIINGKKNPWPIEVNPDKKAYLRDILSRKTVARVAGKLIRRSLYVDHSIRNVEGINNSEDFQVYSQLLYYANSIGVERKAEYMYDLGNSNSYSNSHKEDSEKQIFQSIDILRRFYRKNAPKYLPCLDEAEFVALTWNLKHWCYVQGHDEFFNSIKRKLLSYDKSKLKTLDMRAKLALYGNRKLIQAIYKLIH